MILPEGTPAPESAERICLAIFEAAAELADPDGIWILTIPVDIEATWVEEHDDELSPMGGKGIGEIGTVGSPAAIGNAVFHATGVRVRDLPITLDKVLPHL